MTSAKPNARSLFEQALGLSPAQRTTFVDAACGHDPDLLREVCGLLAADAHVDGFLEVAAIAESPLVGRELGNYRIVRMLGEGGMGVVYEAIQREPERPVALKVLRGGFATPTMLARFHREAALLARLEHPGIARIYESGAFEVGGDRVPFLAMELIAGARDLAEHVVQHAPDRRQRLLLFAQISEAVAMAHRHGVVHRDLKPGNILIGADGRPRVIDFGIARALTGAFDGALDSAQLATLTGQFVGTPRYMSPEQLRGDNKDVDTRTDVWSLGLILFELLTGESPFELDGLALTGIAEVISEREPRRLSFADSTLRGDLEVIVSHCLRKDPAERYQSALELQQEIERLLAGEPIEARRDHTLYVLQRRLRRHRVLLITAATILIAAVGSGIGFALLWQQAVDARDHSERSLYESQIAVAANSLRSFRSKDLKSTLAACAPDRRGWEWHHLLARSDDALWTVRPGSKGAEILCMCASADGQLLAVGLVDGTIGLLDAATGAERGRLPPHRRGVVDVAFLPGAVSRLASVCWDGTARLWDLDAGKELHSMAHDGEVWRVAVTPDGSRLLTGTRGGVLSAWDPATGALLWQQRHHTGGVTSLVMNHAGTVLASGSRDLTVCLTDVVTGDVLRRIDKSVQQSVVGLPDVPAHGSPVFGLAFQHGDRFLFSASEDGVGKLWDTHNGVLLFYEMTGHQVTRIALSPDGAVLAMAGRDAVLLRSTLEGRVLEPLRGHDGHIGQLAFDPGGRHLLVADQYEVRCFDVAARSGLQALGRMSAPVYSMCTPADHSSVCVADEAGQVRVLRAADLAPVATFQAHDARIRWLAADATGKRLWTGADDRRVRGFRLPAGEQVAEAECLPYPRVAWAPGYVAVAGQGPDLVLRSDVDLTELRRVTTMDEVITGLATTRDGSHILTAGRAGWIRIWDAVSLQLLGQWQAHDGQVGNMVWNGDESLLASHAGDAQLKVWRFADRSLHMNWEEIGGPCNIAWTADGSRIFVCAGRLPPRLLAAHTGSTLLELDAVYPSNMMWFGAVGLDGDRFVTGEAVGGLSLWSTESLNGR